MHRRFWVHLLLVVLNAVCHVERVNLSLERQLIPREFSLSPVALGYLF